MKMILALVAAVATAGAGATAQPSSSTASVPIRALSTPLAATTLPIRTALGLRQMAGGKVLVNDPISHRLILFDSTLKTFAVLRDSAQGLADSYGARAAILVPYLADSALFVDMASQSLIVVDPAGAFGRVMAPPNPRDLSLLQRPCAGADAKGRLVYQGSGGLQQRTQPAATPGVPRVYESSDSAPVVRADFDTRTVDTIGHIKITQGSRRVATTDASGVIHNTLYTNPLQSVDDWAMLPDGTVAFVRGHDYHIDWLAPDGTRTSSPKMPFDWRRLTDDDKQKLIDSVRTQQQKQQLARDSALAAARAAGAASGRAGEGRAGVGRAGGGDLIRIGPGGDVVVSGGATTESLFVPLNEIVDYYPPIRSGAVRADLNGNIWILPTTTAQSKNGELVYDVVNRKGELFERVRLPEGRSLAGFGRGGVVYLQWRDVDKGYFVERTRVVR